MGQASASMSAGRAAAVAVVACTVLVAVLATLAASIGTGDVLRGDGPTRVAGTPEVPTPPTSDTGAIPPPGPDLTDQNHRPTWVAVVQIIVISAFVAAALFGCAMLLRRLRLPRLKRKAAPGQAIDFEVLPPASAIASAIAADADRQWQVLLSGAPRNAIIECWNRFEVQAAAAGVQRERWETSSELTLRVLTTIGASPSAVIGLADVYREARFSRHEVGEDLRDRAVELLREIQDSLRHSGASS